MSLYRREAQRILRHGTVWCHNFIVTLLVAAGNNHNAQQAQPRKPMLQARAWHILWHAKQDPDQDNKQRRPRSGRVLKSCQAERPWEMAWKIDGFYSDGRTDLHVVAVE